MLLINDQQYNHQYQNNNISKVERNLELVLVVGDIGWGDGLYESVEELEKLQIPYVPIIGDNEVAYGSQFDFEVAFSDAWIRLYEQFSDYEAQIGETSNIELGIQSSFCAFRGLNLAESFQ